MEKGQQKDTNTMGMAASQARLLQITARQHDIEFQAQSIQNAKIQLSTKSDQVYQEYLDALDATTMTLTAIDGAANKSNVPATFNNLCSKNRLTAADGSEYALKDSKGRLIVEESIYEGYQSFISNTSALGRSAQAFALYMMTGQTYDVNDIDMAEDSIDVSGDTKLQSLKDDMIAIVKKVYDDDDEVVFYDTNAVLSCSEEDQAEYQNLLYNFKNLLYKSNAENIFKRLPGNQGEEFNEEEFNYYVSIYNQIQAAGGRCVSINDFNGTIGDSDAANNSEWLQAMVECGKITLHKTSTDKKTGRISLTTTSPSSDTAIGYVETSTIDKTALAKAEAKYEHDLKLIDKKDKQRDTSNYKQVSKFYLS